MRLKAFASAAALALLLAGCQHSVGGAGLVKPSLPPIPRDLAAACIDPGVRKGKTILGEFARNRQALAACIRRHGGTVNFYNDVRKRFGG